MSHLRFGEHLGASTAGVIRVFGMSVQNGAIVFQSLQIRQHSPRLADQHEVFMRGLQPGRGHPLDGRKFSGRARVI